MNWHGCYDSGWQGLIVPESFSHPAKYARGLVERIYDYLLSTGRLVRGNTVIDPFGGVALGGIIGASKGLRWIGCELEPRFVGLAEQNIALHRRTWEAAGDPLPRIVQGDSRGLSDVLGPVLAEAIMSSPPYNLPMSQDHNGARGGKRGTEPSEAGAFVKYGSTPGQLEGMPMGDVDAVVSSPPYAECLRGDNSAKETAAESQAKRLTPGGSLGQSCRHQGYGSDENLGNLTAGSVDGVLSSPPYEPDVIRKRDIGKSMQGATRGQHSCDAYGTTNGQLAALPAGTVDGVVSSPPFMDPNAGHRNNEAEIAAGKIPKIGLVNANDYADMTPGQLAATTGQTFWAASRLIVLQCRLLLKPRGVAVFVTKDFVRNKQRVPFSDDWRRLCEACGFRMVEWIKASLVKETVENQLFGGPTTRRKERKSFFRRLAEKKGSPRIDHEDVLVMERL